MTLLLLLTQCAQAPAGNVPSESPPAPPQQSRSQVPASAWSFRADTAPTTLAGGAARHQMLATGPEGQMRLDVVIFDARTHRLRVIDQPDPQAGGRAMSELLQREGASAGVNGGFFTRDFAPMGLVIAGGRRTGSFAQTKLLTGLVIQLGDQPYLIWNSEYQGTSGISDLLQTGPRLVSSNAPVAGLERNQKRKRTFIATDGRYLWAIGVADICSLAQLAEALAAPGCLPELRTLRALNLDGGNSSGLWMRTAEGREISLPGWSTVRNYLAIIPK